MTLLTDVTDIAQLRAHAIARGELCEQVKAVIVDCLDLPIDPEWITDDQPLFGRGLELDSVDALELALGIESEFGAQIDDSQMDVFGSVNRIVDYIQQERAESFDL